jgi:hypothetical protein
MTSGIKMNDQAGENENEMKESWQTIPYKYKKFFGTNQVIGYVIHYEYIPSR